MNTRPYRSVFFLHGASGTESADAAGFSGWVAKDIEKGMLPPVLVVFPNGGMSGYRGAVEKMTVEELIPLIDRTYPTLARPESRAAVGFSMGGAGRCLSGRSISCIFCRCRTDTGHFGRS